MHDFERFNSFRGLYLFVGVVQNSAWLMGILHVAGCVLKVPVFACFLMFLRAVRRIVEVQ